MNENQGLFLILLLFGVMIAICSFYVGYECGFDDCFIEMREQIKVTYSNVD